MAGTVNLNPDPANRLWVVLPRPEGLPVVLTSGEILTARILYIQGEAALLALRGAQVQAQLSVDHGLLQVGSTVALRVQEVTPHRVTLQLLSEQEWQSFGLPGEEQVLHALGLRLTPEHLLALRTLVRQGLPLTRENIIAAAGAWERYASGIDAAPAGEGEAGPTAAPAAPPRAGTPPTAELPSTRGRAEANILPATGPFSPAEGAPISLAHPSAEGAGASAGVEPPGATPVRTDLPSASLRESSQALWEAIVHLLDRNLPLTPAAVAAAVQYPFSTGEGVSQSPLDLGQVLAALTEELAGPAGEAGSVGEAPAPGKEAARAVSEALLPLDHFLQEPERGSHLLPMLQRTVQALGLLRAPLQHLLEAWSKSNSPSAPDSPAASRADAPPQPSDSMPSTPLPTSTRPAAVQQLAEQALANLTAQQMASQPPAQSGAPHFLYLQLPLLINGQPQTAELAIRVRRDEKGRPAVDPAKMHVICRLSTRHLGVVQVELLTAGRTLDVDLETETPEVEALFREREEDLRQLVKRAGYQPGEVSFRIRPQRQRSVLPPLELRLTGVDLRL